MKNKKQLKKFIAAALLTLCLIPAGINVAQAAELTPQATAASIIATTDAQESKDKARFYKFGGALLVILLGSYILVSVKTKRK